MDLVNSVGFALARKGDCSINFAGEDKPRTYMHGSIPLELLLMLPLGVVHDAVKNKVLKLWRAPINRCGKHQLYVAYCHIIYSIYNINIL